MTREPEEWELDVHQQRRRILWQRVYLQSLEQLVAKPPASATTPRSLAILAGQDASEAVLQLDDWERQQQGGAAPRAASAAGGDGGGEADDDPDNQYLGR